MLSRSEASTYTKIFDALSDPTRLQIIAALADGPKHVGELTKLVGSNSQPAVSHHIALLRHGRMIQPRREGKHNYYELMPGLFGECAQLLNALDGGKASVETSATVTTNPSYNIELKPIARPGTKAKATAKTASKPAAKSKAKPKSAVKGSKSKAKSSAKASKAKASKASAEANGAPVEPVTV